VWEPKKSMDGAQNGPSLPGAVAEKKPAQIYACILIIEDSSGQLEHILSVLRNAGHDAHGAEDWAACRAALNRIEPQLVLLDVNLSGMQGGDILAIQLKKNPKLQKASIIFHSASRETDLQLMVRRTGVDGYIVKSNKDSYLLEQIRHFLEAKAVANQSKKQ
jgi:CheY-like chemotaxis protein